MLQSPLPSTVELGEEGEMVFLKELLIPKAFFLRVRGFHFHGSSRRETNSSLPSFLLSDESNVREAVKELESAKNVEIAAYARLLESCTRSKLLEEGKRVHKHLIKNGGWAKTGPLLVEKVACMYINCGEIGIARVIFDEIQEPSTFLWNSMIRGYAWNGPFEKAIELYFQMVELGVKPNKFTFPFVLKGCSGLLALGDAREIHVHAMKYGMDTDLFVATALVDLYGKCGFLDDAYKVFGKMPKKDVAAWSALIAGSSLHGFYDDTVGLVSSMQMEGTSPNSSTMVAILPAVGLAKALREGKSIHGYCVRRCFSRENVIVETALLDMYARCECFDYSGKVFHLMIVKNQVTWSAMIGAYVLSEETTEALSLFAKMMAEEFLNPTSATLALVLKACAKLENFNTGKVLHSYSIKSGFFLDATVANSLISMYSKSGALHDAVGLFDEMKVKDAISYSAIISGCAQNGNAKEALFIFQQMQSDGIQPDIAILVGLIPACAHLAALQHGMCIHGYVTISGFASEVSICNSLIDMYSKCGRVDLAREVFSRMSARDIISWNAIIAGYGIHGLGTESLNLFHDMQHHGLEPDDVSFISLLYACSHSGLVAQGKHLFYVMDRTFKIVPRMEHYICMVDLLSRAGHLDEAYNFIKGMPFEADVRVWGALLGGCRVYKNVELGEEVSRMIQKLGPEGTGNFVLMSNLYSTAGRWHDAANIRIVQQDKGLIKIPGCSWIEIDRTVHAFVGGDNTHPQSVSIYETLEELLREMKKLGYESDASFVLHDVEEEEKERILLYHSEKLAIAFGILTLGPGKPITVTKNLRVCADCHTAIKLISMITRRAITVRDANRFHHFTEGSCTCRDFW